MDLKSAVAKFYSLYGPQVNSNVQAVGEGDGKIMLYLRNRNPLAKLPENFEGWPVTTRVVGNFAPLGT